MKEVLLIAAVSADGKIAQKEGQVSLDWTSKEDLRFFVKKTKEAGVVVFGRKTYETIGKPLKDRLNIVLTRSIEGQEGIPGLLEWSSETPEDLIKRLDQNGHERVAICGGAQVYDLFLASGLVTDVYLTIEPVLFGKGTPLVRDVDRVNMELVEVEKLNESTMMLHYRVKGEGS